VIDGYGRIDCATAKEVNTIGKSAVKFVEIAVRDTHQGGFRYTLKP